ncbi:cytochrome c biogenesis CcdA family protein [Saccharopolyspora indica]|uniref:cytochrome c biogenesis CcdA family protein n=1 Tax=Saccharopolyspora indica TaxID=1229659 RepID=UPI0022EB8DD2|nr:cytochrome c biogenesis CcdA family protein [Saccharopolyspora indica]MDA3644085.1 cytochrome c biogenesis CcdA family protein [Saccharopolyspora indica]
MELFALLSLAIVAGVVSFSSPCTLPLLPGYVSYVAGLSGDRPSRRKTVLGALLFTAGFSAVFTALGVTSSALGFLLARNQRLLEVIGGALIIVMALTMLGVLRIGLLQRQLRADLTRFGRGPAAALPLGAAFAFGWTPCVGPVLASILTVAASTSTAAEGAVLLLAYSAGLGLPFVLLAIGIARGRVELGWLRRNARRIELFGGLLLAAMGIAMLTGGWTALMSGVLGFYARLGWPPI